MTAASFPLGPARPRVLAGERLACGLAAAAVACLPLLSPGGPASLAPVDLVIALAVCAFLLWAGWSGRRLRFPYVAAAGVFMAGGALGALVGPLPKAGALALAQDAWLLVWGWALVNLANSARRLGLLVAAWAYSAIAWAAVLVAGLLAGVPALTGQNATEGARTSLTFLDPNFAANYFFISIMVVWASGRPRSRGWRLAAYALIVLALLSTGSNSGFVALAVGVGVAGVLGVRRRHGAAAAVAAAAACLLGAQAAAGLIDVNSVQAAAQRSSNPFLRDGIGRGATSLGQRDVLVRESFRLYRADGPLGGGPVSTKARLRNELAPFSKEAHNDYLAALVERGALGLLGLVLLLAAVGMHAGGAAAGRPKRSFAQAVPRPNALAGAVAGTAVAAAMNELLHVRHVWALFALVAALSLWGRR